MNRYDVVMIVDEVKTGFRVARGGVQELMGFKADLCTMAKAIGNGYPISVVAGREDIMRQIGKGVIHGGTYTCHSVSLAAAEKTLEILDETDALETHRRVWNRHAERHEQSPGRPWNTSLFHRASRHGWPVFSRNAAGQLP